MLPELMLLCLPCDMTLRNFESFGPAFMSWLVTMVLTHYLIVIPHSPTISSLVSSCTNFPRNLSISDLDTTHMTEVVCLTLKSPLCSSASASKGQSTVPLGSAEVSTRHWRSISLSSSELCRWSSGAYVCGHCPSTKPPSCPCIDLGS